MRTTADHILMLLKTRGPAPTQALAEAAGVTRQAAREHLENLAATGLVGHVDERAGVGRPRRSWSLTAKGHQRFPDTHAQMTIELIDAVREEFGETGLDRLVDRRERAMEAAYRGALGAASALEQRLDRLASARSGEGYMAEWRRLADGEYLFVENHCPVCAAARACRGICRSELQLFQRLLEPATVERTEHVLAGARRCAYLVRDKGGAHRAP